MDKCIKYEDNVENYYFLLISTYETQLKNTYTLNNDLTKGDVISVHEIHNKTRRKI